MTARPTLPNSANGTLRQPDAFDEMAVINQWRRTVSGMDGKRGDMPERPDDLVAYRLLDAAGEAMDRGQWKNGVNILRLVIRDYGQSQEAAFARRVIDRLAEQANGRAR